MLDSNPTVSVIILSYNQSKYLSDAIQSVLDQTYQNFEIIISDNGSTDSSKEIIKNFLHDRRIIFLDYKENLSISIRQNQAARKASGSFISLLYSDDYYLPSKLENQIKIFSSLSEEWGVVHGPGIELDDFTGRQQPIPATAAHGKCLNFLFRNYADGFINPIAPLVRRQVYLEFPLYEDMFSEGESLYWRIATKYKFFYSDDPLVVMRYHNKNMGKAIKKNMEMHLVCLDRLEASDGFPTSSITLLRKYKSQIIFSNAWHCIRTNFEIQWAKKIIFSSIKSYPRGLFSLRYLTAIIFLFIPKRLLHQVNKLINRIFQKKFTTPLDDYYN